MDVYLFQYNTIWEKRKNYFVFFRRNFSKERKNPSGRGRREGSQVTGGSSVRADRLTSAGSAANSRKNWDWRR